MPAIDCTCYGSGTVWQDQSPAHGLLRVWEEPQNVTAPVSRLIFQIAMYCAVVAGAGECWLWNESAKMPGPAGITPVVTCLHAREAILASCISPLHACIWPFASLITNE
jgi:hypothetical protein